MKKAILSLTALALFACSSEPKETTGTEVQKSVETDAYPELMEKAQAFFGALPTVAENVNNPLSDKKVALGKKLYFDKQLSKDNTISCNSCHDLAAFGVDNLPVSPGNDEGTFGDRNSPTVYNAALHISQFWDGRAVDVEEQAGGPILNPVEMAIPTKEFLIDRLSKDEEYPSLFAEVFPESNEPLSYENIQLSIGAFERTLMTPSPFDAYLDGDSKALTNKEKEGLETFMNVGCTTCHTGNVLGGNMYQKFGLINNYWEETHSENIDEGRFKETQVEADKYVFKVPTLRNVEKTAPYFHDGSVADLNKAVIIMGRVQLNKELSPKETVAIVSFLKSLTGEIPQEFQAK